jgi:hypothetical protein
MKFNARNNGSSDFEYIDLESRNQNFRMTIPKSKDDSPDAEVESNV